MQAICCPSYLWKVKSKSYCGYKRIDVEPGLIVIGHLHTCKVQLFFIKHYGIQIVMEFLFNYGLFLAKTATVVIAIAMVMLFFVVMASKKQADKKDSIEIKKLNEKYDGMVMTMNASMLHKEGFKKYLKEEKEKLKGIVKELKDGAQKKRIFVVNFHGDIRASAVSSLREEITAILTVATEEDEVFVRLESGGGVVHGYGLGASQLMRIREKIFPLPFQ